MEPTITINKHSDVDFSVPKVAKRMNKTPLVVIEHPRTGFVYYVMKVNRKMDDPYASAFCRVVSQFTGPSGDLGDTYISDILGGLVIQVAGVDQIVPVMCNTREIFAKAIHFAAKMREAQK